MASSRNNSTQPPYDFLAGAASPAPSHQSFRQSHIVRPDSGNEDLRAEIKALQYELSTFKQERDMLVFRHSKEVRDVQVKAEADFRRAQNQASESESHIAARKYESLAKELKEAQDLAASEKTCLETKLQTAYKENQALEEEIEETRSELSTYERQSGHRIRELQKRIEALEENNETLHHGIEERATALYDAQQRLSERETALGNLESEVLRLKAHAGDADTLSVIKRELSEQVGHIKKLESVNRDQLIELKHYRKLHKSVELVEEEKRGLENKLRAMDDIRSELAEVQLQKQILEDERKSWTVYLQNESTASGQAEFESPEALARALAEERLDRVALVEKMGALEPELSEKDNLIKSLEAENFRLKGGSEKPRLGGGPNHAGALARLERQRALAVKEVEFLRVQLNTFDAEETTFQPETLSEERTRRIQELEGLVDQYRTELRNLNEELAKRDNGASPITEQPSAKRPREDEPDERLGLLSRKNRKLQDEALRLHQSIAGLTKELEVAKNQAASMQNNPRTRIIELRSNPTADAAAIRTATLSALRHENTALLAQLEGNYNAKVVPISTLENARQDIKDMEKRVAEKEKRMTRLKEIWSAKSLEFREAVASVLGWKMDFMPNGRVRVTSMFYPGDEGEGEGNSIIFDGENGTMKISGGPNGPFALEIKGLIRFWVEERKEIPCFLAAMTLEFYERTTRAARM